MEKNYLIRLEIAVALKNLKIKSDGFRKNAKKKNLWRNYLMNYSTEFYLCIETVLIVYIEIVLIVYIEIVLIVYIEIVLIMCMEIVLIV